MNFLKNILFASTMASLILFSGCGDLFQKNVDDTKIESNKFKIPCELNVDEFALILEEDIGDAIGCLGKNLKLFSKVVESKKPGYLSRKALENYILRMHKDIKPEVFKILKTVFEINFLIYGEDPEYISEANIDALINAAMIFNENAAKNFSPIFKSKDSLDLETYRFLRDQKIRPAALNISTALRNIFKTNRDGKIHKLDLNALLDSFTSDNNEASMKDVKKLLFLKKVILGGEKDELTHLELAHLIDNFSSYSLLILDALRFSDIRHSQESEVQLLYEDVETLNSLIFSENLGNRDSTTLFSLQDLVDAVDIMVEDQDFDLSKYYDLLKEAKLMLMDGSSPELITGADLRRLFAHALKLLKTGTRFHRYWYIEKAILEAKPGRPLTYDFKNLYSQFPGEKSRIDDFVRILKTYRFMKGENISAFYTDEYWRNADAVYEIAVYEYALTLVMKRFGCPNNNLDGKVVCEPKTTLNGVYMKTDHVIALIEKFKKVLIEADLIYPGREAKTAETITLLGSLFQYQSDENKVFDVNEATEFAISLFTSIDVADDLNNHFVKLNKQGKCEMDKFGRVSPTCFREHFFRGVCLNYPDQFPKLFQSMGATVYENRKLVCRIPMDAANLAYLNTTIKASRTCNFYPNTSEEIYYSKSDSMSVWMAMMHIETTILRWDVRKHNNVMDPDEVMDAYNIYSPALDGFLETMPPMIKKLKKQIYQYLVKYEQVPNEKEFSSIWKFAKFLLSFKKEATANRKTIASILKTIGEQGAPDTFDCSLLRDPTRINKDLDERVPSDSVSREIPASVKPMTRSDKSMAFEIEQESDASVRKYLEEQWPEVFGF